MITTPDDIRTRYKVEQSASDDYLTQIIGDVEIYLDKTIHDIYQLWQDNQEQYPTECKAVRDAVAEFVVAKLVNKCYFVVTAFGTVVKIDDYSQQLTEDQRRDVVNALTNSGSAQMRKIITANGGKYNYFDYLADVVSAHENF